MQQLLASQAVVEAARQRASVPRRTELVPFNNRYVTVYTHDEYGLVLDPKMWVSSKCKHGCKGEGFLWSVREPDKHRMMTPCPCAMKGYKKAREQIERRLKKAVDKGAELTAIHRELGSNLVLDVREVADGRYIGVPTGVPLVLTSDSTADTKR